MYDDFVPLMGTENRISMIFCDFWETKKFVDLAITLSNDCEMKSTSRSGGHDRFHGASLKAKARPR